MNRQINPQLAASDHFGLNNKTEPLLEQTNQLSIPPQRPATEDYDAWRAYWEAQNQTWRTEPEIDTKRQEELAACRATIPVIEKGIYPFKGMKLCRADIEWLLATHENGRGPIDWSHKNQREREGLDLRGADLCEVDLRKLPLACLNGGFIMALEM